MTQNNSYDLNNHQIQSGGETKELEDTQIKLSPVETTKKSSTGYAFNNYN